MTYIKDKCVFGKTRHCGEFFQCGQMELIINRERLFPFTPVKARAYLQKSLGFTTAPCWVFFTQITIYEVIYFIKLPCYSFNWQPTLTNGCVNAAISDIWLNSSVPAGPLFSLRRQSTQVSWHGGRTQYERRGHVVSTVWPRLWWR